MFRAFLFLIPALIHLPVISAGRPDVQNSPDSLAQSSAAGSAQNGASLFAGIARFENGGPPCAACHSVRGLKFPNGGTLGPDLSRSAVKLGPKGMDSALQTLFFPTMTPIFDTRPLTVAEQRDLKAFLDQAAGGPPPPDIIPIMASIAIFGLLVLLAFTWGIWRRRLLGVRSTLVRSATRGGNRE